MSESSALGTGTAGVTESGTADAPSAPETADGTPPSGSSRRWIVAGVVIAVLGIAAVPAWRHTADRRAKQLLAECEDAQAASDWKALQQHSADWLWWQPENGQAIVYRALAAEQLGDARAASDFLNSLPDDSEFAIAGLSSRVDILLSRLNEVSEAEATCRRMLKINPATGRAQQRLIYIYSLTQRVSDLRTQAFDAIRNGCEPPETYPYLFISEALDFENGLNTTTRWLLGEPDNEDVLVAQAIYAHRSRKRDDQARMLIRRSDGRTTQFEKACEDFPSNLALLAHRIQFHIENAEWEPAGALLSSAPSEALEDGRFWRFKAQIHENQGELNEAKTAVEKALELNPLSWRTRMLYSAVLRQTSDLEEVKAQSELALKGKELERELLALDDARGWVQSPLAHRMVLHGEACGDKFIAEALASRLASGAPSQSIQNMPR